MNLPLMTVVTVRIWRKIDIEIGIGDEIDREGEVIPRLMVTDLVTMGTVSYPPSIVTMAVSAAILEIFSVKEWPDL